MQVEFFTPNPQKKSELVVVPFFEGNQSPEGAALASHQYTEDRSPTLMKDFKGKEGELLFLYPSKEKIEQRIVWIGLGRKKNLNIEKLRRIYATLTRACHQKHITEINLLLPQILEMGENDVVIGIAEGILLANYGFDQLKQLRKPEGVNLLKKVNVLGISKQGLLTAKRCKIIAEGVYLARDLVNGNADDVNPEYLSHIAQELARKLPHTRATILNKKQIEKEKLGLLLAVNRGSDKDPALIILSYQGHPQSKEHTVLIGKGITYDTGGLNLKPMTSMETMKADMAGGAAVLGTLYAAASLGLKINVTAVIPATENSIDAKSYKIGDVYKSSCGLTVEVNNPDAEGRLVLAEAITYANKKLHPTRIIDIATLTGGIEIALGSEASGLFTNHQGLADSLQRSGERTYERVWRFPLYEEYRDALKSDIADIRNSAGRSASSIIAAMFLQEFVEETPWAHLDIASTAYMNDKKRYHPKYGTGYGVRLLVDFLSTL